MTELDIKYSEKKKFEAGKAEGLAEGIAQGKSEGLAEGRFEVARNLVAMGMPVEKIAEVTGLIEEQLKELM